MRTKQLAATPLLALALTGMNSTLAQDDAPPDTRADSSVADTIVVTGSEAALAAAAAEIALTPGGATTVDLADLAERNVGSLADALRYVPGVFIESDAGNDGIFFSSRGSNLDATDYDMNGIKLLQDGLPVTTADGVFGSEAKEVGAILMPAERGSAWTLRYPRYTVIVPGPDQIKVPLTYVLPADEPQLRALVDTFIDLKRNDGTIQRLYEYWILGRDASAAPPRWSIIRDVLHWVE